MALATDADVRTLITGSYFRYLIIILAGIGFFSYIATAIFSLRAFYEPKWVPAPVFPIVRSTEDLEHSVDVYWDKFPMKYDRKDAAKQLASGIDYNQGVNDKKYDNLRIASFSLMIGIFASVIAGVALLLMSMEPMTVIPANTP